MQLTEVDATNVTKLHLDDNNAIHTVIICLNSVNIHKYWLKIVGDNLNYHLYYIWIPSDMYVTLNINNCNKTCQVAGFLKSRKLAH